MNKTEEIELLRNKLIDKNKTIVRILKEWKKDIIIHFLTHFLMLIVIGMFIINS